MARTKKSKAAIASANAADAKQKSTYPEPVDPFQVVLPELERICDILDKDKIYISHIDETPIDLKRRVFMVPVWMNAFFALGLLVRLYYAIPFYCSFIISYFGRQGDPWIEADKLQWLEFMSLVISRLAIVAFDMFLSTKVISWPVAFCFGAPASPVNWRMAVGFQEKEIIIRRSRSFHEDFKSSRTTNDLLTVKIFATEALDNQSIQKTAYTMIADKRWDLDFAAMIEAHEVLAKSKGLSISWLDRKVLAHNSRDDRWQIWHLDGKSQEMPLPEHDNVARLEKYLRQKRRETLFYRYIELVQYETSLSDANTHKRRHAMIQQLEEEFAKAQLNFKTVVEDIGGLQNMPGFEDDLAS